MKQHTRETVREAIATLGGVCAVAKRLKLTQPAVTQWISRGQVSQHYALTLEKLTAKRGNKVSRHRLRPDIFGPA